MLTENTKNTLPSLGALEHTAGNNNYAHASFLSDSHEGISYSGNNLKQEVWMETHMEPYDALPVTTMPFCSIALPKIAKNDDVAWDNMTS